MVPPNESGADMAASKLDPIDLKILDAIAKRRTPPTHSRQAA